MGDKVEDLVAAGGTRGLELLGLLKEAGAMSSGELKAYQEVTGLTAAEVGAHMDEVRVNGVSSGASWDSITEIASIGAGGGTSDTFTTTHIANANEGDLMFITFGHYGGVTAHTEPTGWTKLRKANDDGATYLAGVYYRVADADDAAGNNSYSMTGGSDGFIWRAQLYIMANPSATTVTLEDSSATSYDGTAISFPVTADTVTDAGSFKLFVWHQCSETVTCTFTDSDDEIVSGDDHYSHNSGSHIYTAFVNPGGSEPVTLTGNTEGSAWNDGCWMSLDITLE